MEKIVGDWSTTVKLTGKEAKDICKLGKGSECCAFLVMGKGFECCRMDMSMSGTILNKLDAGTMNAKGKGRWKGCAWEVVE